MENADCETAMRCRRNSAWPALEPRCLWLGNFSPGLRLVDCGRHGYELEATHCHDLYTQLPEEVEQLVAQDTQRIYTQSQGRGAQLEERISRRTSPRSSRRSRQKKPPSKEAIDTRRLNRSSKQ